MPGERLTVVRAHWEQLEYIIMGERLTVVRAHWEQLEYIIISSGIAILGAVTLHDAADITHTISIGAAHG